VSGRDPAAARFAVIQVLRLSGVALVILGLVIVAGPSQRLSGLPDWVGYILLIAGLADVFVVPTLLARRWRSPPE
jgi:uncharacterized membrane protein HdeD (DUF308 family)